MLSMRIHSCHRLIFPSLFVIWCIAVNNVNKALEGQPIPALVDLQKSAMSSPVLRNNGGGHYNHAMFWTTLAPASKSGKPSPPLAKAIDS